MQQEGIDVVRNGTSPPQIHNAVLRLALDSAARSMGGQQYVLSNTKMFQNQQGQSIDSLAG
jgi:hypothetical protein